MPSCFVVMPITTPPSLIEDYQGDADHFTHVLNYLFAPAIDSAGFTLIPPSAEGNEIIHARIIRHLETADIVLCDMSSLNANVFFEFGIRVAIDKPVYVVKDTLTKQIPFDSALINCHTYNWDLAAWNVAPQIEALTKHLTTQQSDSKSLWQLFGLSARAHAAEPKDKEGAALDYLTLTVESLTKKSIRCRMKENPPKVFLVNA